MCGILGSINVSETASVLPLIRHRGPDASGEETYFINEYEVKFLHRRLSIVDLTVAGNQPMTSSDYGSNIVFNGEIYNHQDLKDKLGDIAFRGHSDTETIIEYFNALGIEETISHLNGIFAIGFLDQKKKKLYLARDRFGVKPLYYFLNGNKLIFSSELRPLKKLLNPYIDTNAVMLGLQLRYIPSPFTLYQNIRKVEPGQLLTFDLNNTSVRFTKKYFPEYQKKIGSKKGELKQLVKEYGNLFEKAVERQMMADVEIGILLSGGIDSALVASVAKNKTNRKLKAFTVGFSGDYSGIDEVELAKETAEILGLEHFEKKIGFPDFINSLSKAVEIVEEPLATTSIIPMYTLAELASSKVKVVLSGQGADEPLGGYDKYKGLIWLEKLRFLRHLIPSSKIFERLFRPNEKVRRMLDALKSPTDMACYLNFNSIFTRREMSHLLKSSGQRNFLISEQILTGVYEDVLASKQPHFSSLKDMFLYNDLRTSLSDDLLIYTDKITMHFSLECRVPILDNELVEFMESLQTQYKFNLHKNKIIHKEFAREYLPSKLISRKKMDFHSPTSEWFRQHLKEIEAVFFTGNNDSGFFDMQSVKNILAAHKGGYNLEKQIFLLLSINKLLSGDNCVFDHSRKPMINDLKLNVNEPVGHTGNLTGRVEL